jgi:hypothetical protein
MQSNYLVAERPTIGQIGKLCQIGLATAGKSQSQPRTLPHFARRGNQAGFGWTFSSPWLSPEPGEPGGRLAMFAFMKRQRHCFVFSQLRKHESDALNLIPLSIFFGIADLHSNR